MKKHIFIFCVFTVIAFAIFTEPMKAFFFDKAKVENELRAKNAEKDSLSKVLENIKNNPDDLEKNARNSGYAKKGETMLKIVPVNIEEESRKLKISAFLLLALAVIILLIIVFAIPKKTDEKSCQQSTNMPQ